MEGFEYTMHYRCPDDGTEWAMSWDCICDDRCPTCNHEIEPYKTERSPGGQARITDSEGGNAAGSSKYRSV